MTNSALNLAEKNELSELDGLFLTRADVEMNSDNVRRLEQRLINSQDYNYFRTDNKELKIDNKLFDSKLFRRNDISIIKNSFHNYINRNAVICERLNQKKKTYYLMEMFIGKLSIDNHHFFEKEDKLASRLKLQMRGYKEKVDKSALPHLAEILAEQLEVKNQLSAQPKANASDLALINKQIQETQSRIRVEKGEMSDCMLDLYQTWRDIKTTRQVQGYDSTGVKIAVQEYRNDKDDLEQYVLLRDGIANEKTTFSGKSLPSKELSRRDSVRKTLYFLKIYINNELMATTAKTPIQWPSFEIEFKEHFDIFVYTKPYSIAIEVCEAGLITHVLDRIEVDIPGEHANSLTSAGTIIREVAYSKKRFLKASKEENKKPKGEPKTPELSNAANNQMNGPPVVTQVNGLPVVLSAANPGLVGPITDNGMRPTGENPDVKNNNAVHDDVFNNRKLDDDLNTEAPDDDIPLEEVPYEVLESGRINIEVGWKGFGPKLPPLNTGGFGIFRQRKKEKHLYQALPQSDNDVERDEILIDVNDPRNNDYVEKVREIRNNYLRSLLRNDMKLPLSDVKSIRHELMKLYLSEYREKKKAVPLLEREIVADEDLMKLIQHHYEERMKIRMNNETIRMEKTNQAYSRMRSQVDMFPQNQETQARIYKTKMTLYQKQGDIKMKKNLGTSDSTTLHNVIDEFKFGDQDNNFIKQFMTIFDERRKFRKKQVKETKVDPTNISECKISIQAIKGTNVPARSSTLKSQMDGVVVRQPNSEIGFSQYRNRELGEVERLALDVFADPKYEPKLHDRAANDIPQLMDNEGIMFAEDNTLYKSQDYDLPSTLVKVSLFDRNKNVIIENESSTFDGLDPEWNDTMELKYTARDGSNAFSTIDLLTNEANIYVTLFDSLATWEKHSLNPHQKIVDIERRYLGSIKIPLVNLFTTPKINSMFKINRPFYLNGYRTAKNSIFSTLDDSNSREGSKYIDPFLPTYVLLSLTCDPVFMLPDSNNTDFVKGEESMQLLLYGKSFLEKIFDQEENKGRNIRLWGYNIEGKSVFIPRYLTPLEPPPEFMQVDPEAGYNTIPTGTGTIDTKADSYQKCARFVSLIPLKGESDLFRDMPEVFMTCQQFIDMRAGDFEEHAILLCNYFMHIDRVNANVEVEHCVIMGRGVPEGKTYYVLRREKNKDVNEIWNPVTGDAYTFFREKLVTKILCFSYVSGTTQVSGSNLTVTQLWTLSVL
jgi:hypothetical protein